MLATFSFGQIAIAFTSNIIHIEKMNFTLALTPLESELKFLVKYLKEYNFESRHEKIGDLPLISFPQLNLKCSLGGHGKVQFAIQTQFLIHRLKNIGRVFCLGAAGGLNDQASIFDVVIAQKTIEHDYKLKFVKRNPPEFQADEALLKQIRRISPHGFKIHFGIVASGDEDVIDSKRAFEIHSATDALVVAWEGAGGAKACKFHDIPFLEIRGITDTANNEAPINFRSNLEKVMSNISTILKEYCLRNSVQR